MKVDDMFPILERIALALETLARAQGPAELNLVRPLAEYPRFDWGSIDASVLKADQFGPTHVEHGGYVYTRRSPQNKFGEAIWYSRATGKAEDGTTSYARLITFKKLAEAEPLGDKVVQAVKAAMPAIAAHQGAAPRLPAPAAPSTPPAAELVDDIPFDDDPPKLSAATVPTAKPTPSPRPKESKETVDAFWRAAFARDMGKEDGLALVNSFGGSYQRALDYLRPPAATA